MSDPDSMYLDLDRATIVHKVASSYSPDITTSAGEPVVVVGVRGDRLVGGAYTDEVLLLPTANAVSLIAQITLSLLDCGLPRAELEDRLGEEMARTARTMTGAGGQLVPGCPRCNRAEPECNCGKVGACL